jgi:hypothetical protein
LFSNSQPFFASLCTRHVVVLLLLLLLLLLLRQ